MISAAWIQLTGPIIARRMTLCAFIAPSAVPSGNSSIPTSSLLGGKAYSNFTFPGLNRARANDTTSLET